MSDINIDNLSDEEFMKLDIKSLQGETPEVKPDVIEPEIKEENKSDDDVNKPDASNDDKSDDDNKSDDDSTSDDKSDKAKPDDKNIDAKDDDAKPEKTEDDKAKSEEAKPEVKVESAVPDYEGFYKEIMKPFKANGKMVELKTPEEAIRLMQAGAGYGKRLQEIQPHLKTIRMLEKNNILDVNKLSYLIDLNNRNPDAIKKLVKESGIDPLDLSNEDAVTYRQSNHSISDEENQFNEILEEVASLDSGVEALKIINTEWDAKSKKFLLAEPKVMKVIQAAVDDGTYAKIKTEIDRQRAIGSIAPNVPFIEAYYEVGVALVEKGELTSAKANQNKVNNNNQQISAPVVIETKVAAVKKEADNNDKASAASSTGSTANKKAVTKVNPLSMSDEDFMKSFDNMKF